MAKSRSASTSWNYSEENTRSSIGSSPRKRSGTDPTSSSGTTTYAYDALGRKITETAPDGSITQNQNCGPNIKVTDAIGKWRRSRLDGLSRLVEVDEPNSTTSSVNACPGSGEPIWVTSYGYDTLGNLTQVIQNGSHQRTFTYNSLSQLLCSSNPESSTVACPVPDSGTYTTGTTRYSYDPVGNLSAKEDARAITTAYQYDALRREINRTYSNGDPSVTTHYDEPTCLFTPCANVGHRTSMTDAAGSEIWSYVDSQITGRSQKRTTTSSPANVTATTHYFFDFAGNLATIWYPFPIFTAMDYTNDSAGRPSTAYDSEQGTHFFGPSKTPPSGCPSTGVCYTPQGTIYSASIGADDGSGGLVLSNTYNNRLQPLELKASYAGVSAMDLTYRFVDPTTLKNNGNVTAITNNLNSGRSQNFAYDQLNRIISAGTNATTGGFCWGYQYSYDSWGNLLSQAGWTPTYSTCVGTIMSPVTADGRNHISGLSYDSSGNTLSDGVNAYSWNGENELKSTAGVTYLYDGDGHRVSKSSGKLYWYGLDGKLLTETDAAGNRLNTYAYLGNQRISEFPAPLGSPALYFAADFLDTSRAIVKQGSSLCYDADFTPFGGERAYTNTCTQDFKFTGKERDSESGLDNFVARYDSWRLGRFMSPDWSASPEPVPYAKLGDPQSLNLYSYVRNNPVTHTDPDGHCWFQSFCNFLNWGHWVDNDHLDAALKKDAERARAEIARTKNMTFNGKSPQDYAAGLNNQQAILAQRALVTVLAGIAMGNLASPCGNSQISCGVVLPLGLGSTGRTVAVDLREQLAMEEVMADPKGTKLPLEMNDQRWPGSQGWVKMSQTVNGVEIHWVENTITGAVDDFKFKK